MADYKHKTVHGLVFSKMDGFNKKDGEKDGRASLTTHVRKIQADAGVGSTVSKPKKSKK